MIPEILTKRELDFIVSHFGLKPGAGVLDLMCGYGRHALGLARSGVRVTAVDNLPSYIEEISVTADAEMLPLEAVCADVLSFRVEGGMDLAICMGNSLNFYDAGDVRRILINTCAALRKGGKLLVNTWSLAEIVNAGFKEESEGVINGVSCHTRSRRLQAPDRIVSVTVFISPPGKKEEKQAVDYVLSLEDYRDLFEQTGFALQEVYSVPGKKFFEAGDPRAYIIAEKR
jgi:SAM-dependent methyltransferase